MAIEATAGGGVVFTGADTRVFQMLAWRSAITLEQHGMRHSSGRSIRKHAAQQLGMPAGARADLVCARIEQRVGLREYTPHEVNEAHAAAIEEGARR